MSTLQKMKRNVQRGFTLIELMIVITALSILGVAVNYGFSYISLQAKAASWSAKVKQTHDGVEAYVNQNFPSLVNGTAIPGVATPLAPTFAELAALQLLPANFQNTSNVGIGMTLGMALTPTGCLPVNCNVSWTLRTNGAPTNALGQPDMNLVSVAAAKIERDAGWSDLANPSVISGAGAAWSIPNPAGSAAGIIATRGGYTYSQFANFIRQNDTRNVNLLGSLTVAGGISTASTINATGNITSAATVQGATVNSTGAITAAGAISGQTLRPTQIVVAGAACPIQGQIAQDANGLTLSCQSGVWRTSDGPKAGTTSWGYGALNICAGGTICRYYSTTVHTDANRVIAVTGMFNATGQYGSSRVEIYIDGVMCGLQRSIDTAGYTPYSNAACLTPAGSGSHAIQVYYISDGSVSITSAHGSISVL